MMIALWRRGLLISVTLSFGEKSHFWKTVDVSAIIDEDPVETFIINNPDYMG